jgi:hypothetical protein
MDRYGQLEIDEALLFGFLVVAQLLTIEHKEAALPSLDHSLVSLLEQVAFQLVLNSRRAVERQNSCAQQARERSIRQSALELLVETHTRVTSSGTERVVNGKDNKRMRVP